MLRSAAIGGVIALCCLGLAPSAEAQSRGGMSVSQGSVGGRSFARVVSPRVQQSGVFFRQRRLFADRRFDRDRDRDDRFFFRDRFFLRDRFPFDFGFGFGGFPYYPYYTANGAGYYPYPGGLPSEGPSADAALPPPWTQVADRPPCRETGPEGVVIVRGTACSRGKPG